MYKVLLLCTGIIFLVILVFFCFIRKHLDNKFILFSCILVFILSILFPLQYVMTSSFYYDEVSIHAIKAEDQSEEKFVKLYKFETNDWTSELYSPCSGNWIYSSSDQSLSWRSSHNSYITDSVTFDIPVGYNRYITFYSGPDAGIVELTYNDDLTRYNLYNENSSSIKIIIPNSNTSLILRDKLIRPLILLVCEIFICIIVYVLVLLYKKYCHSNKTGSIRYIIGVFSLFVLNIVRLSNYPSQLPYSSSYYFMTYEGGFGSRSLLGDLFNRILGPYIDAQLLADLKIYFLLFFYLFLSIIIVRFAFHIPDKKTGVFFIVLILLFPMTYLPINDNLRTDFYLNILFIVGLLCIAYGKMLLSLPVISVILMLNNESSCAFYIAPLMALLIFRFFKDKDIRYLLSLLSSIFFTLYLMFYFFSKGKTNQMTSRAAFSHAKAHTNLPIAFEAFNAESMSLSSHMQDNALNLGSQYYGNYSLLKQAIACFIMLIPFCILITILWKSIYKKQKTIYENDKKNLIFYKMIYMILVASCCMGSICMIIGYDYLRFFSFSAYATFGVIMTIIYIEHLDISINDLFLFNKSSHSMPILLIGILLYFTFLGTINVWTPDTPILPDIVKFIEQIITKGI
jgi:hypothetical protein